MISIFGCSQAWVWELSFSFCIYVLRCLCHKLTCRCTPLDLICTLHDILQHIRCSHSHSLISSVDVSSVTFFHGVLLFCIPSHGTSCTSDSNDFGGLGCIEKVWLDIMCLCSPIPFHVGYIGGVNGCILRKSSIQSFISNKQWATALQGTPYEILVHILCNGNFGYKTYYALKWA